MTEDAILILTRADDTEQIWYAAKEATPVQIQPANTDMTNISNIQFVDADSFLLIGRDSDNNPFSGIYSLQDGRMITKVGNSNRVERPCPKQRGTRVCLRSRRSVCAESKR